MKSITILGVRFDLIGFNQAVDLVCDWAKGNQKRYIVTPNPEFVATAQKDEEFKKIINRADLSITDGRGIQMAARFLNKPVPRRITGTDLMLDLCERFSRVGIPIFLLGGKNGAAQKCAENLKKIYPDIEISGIFEGDGSERGDRETINAVNKTNAKFVFTAFGAPKQEKWIARNLTKLHNVKLVMGVGGAFDYISGSVHRAPLLLRKLGLEWLWRLFHQPRRVMRIFRAVFVFPCLVLKEKLR